MTLACPSRRRKTSSCDFTQLTFRRAGFLQEDLVYPIEGSPSGTAFRTMKPLTLQSPFLGWLNYPVVQAAVREGLKSFCFLPLISRNRAIGTLVLGRLRENAFI